MSVCVSTECSALLSIPYKGHIGQEEKGGSGAILQKLKGVHFLVLSYMQFSKIDGALSESAGNIHFLRGV